MKLHDTQKLRLLFESIRSNQLVELQDILQWEHIETKYPASGDSERDVKTNTYYFASKKDTDIGLIEIPEWALANLLDFIKKHISQTNEQSLPWLKRKRKKKKDGNYIDANTRLTIGDERPFKTLDDVKNNPTNDGSISQSGGGYQIGGMGGSACGGDGGGCAGEDAETQPKSKNILSRLKRISSKDD